MIRTPIELVKCKFQVQLLATNTAATLAARNAATATAVTMNFPVKPVPTSPNFHTLPGPLTILMNTIRTHGLRGLWLGQTGTLIREIGDRKSTRLNSSHSGESRMPSSA